MAEGKFRPNPVTPNEINQNLRYLTANLTNLENILICLIEDLIISDDEYQLINSKPTDLSRNYELLSLLQKKNWPVIKSIFVQILKNTGNEHLADKIEARVELNLNQNSKNYEKWWPEMKTLPIAFHKRQEGNGLLTEKLKEMLSGTASDATAVITQQVTVSGLGGIGKTTTAVWFAEQYEKVYDRILWIDCGEKSLLKSFQNLARDLDVKNRSELDLKELAAASFYILKHWKCLVIFDNAECYIGNEGIKDVLPKFIENFNVLITSRNQKWGDANGDGEIPQLQLNVFEQKEGVSFMKNNIKNLSKDDESHLDLLCQLLGNLPLALQNAVATLNRSKIDNLETYTNKIKNTPEILNSKFDSYEKTINKTLKISLDLIRNHESDNDDNIGEVAYQILLIFGYITPDDVKLEFFLAAVAKQSQTVPSEKIIISKENLYDATAILEDYSLITRRFEGKGHFTLSIHRLLQQVIRHNHKDLEENLLTQILNCNGFLEYKLIPFSYANENLQKKFLRIKAELIDKLHLRKLLKQRRFKEAVELSRIIKNTLKTPVSEYNYAVCLCKHKDVSEFKSVFANLFNLFDGNSIDIIFIQGEYQNKLEVLDSITDIQKMESIMMGQLLLFYIEHQNVANARDFLLKWKVVTIPFVQPNDILTFLNLMSLSNTFLEYHRRTNCITWKVGKKNATPMKLKLAFWILNKNTQFHQDLHDLILIDCTILGTGNALINTKNVTFNNVNMHDNGKGYELADLFDVSKVEKIMFKSMPIEFNSTETIRSYNLKNKNLEMFKWENKEWVLYNGFSFNVDLTQKYPWTLSDITMQHCSVDISILPPSIKKLTLIECSLSNEVKQNSVKEGSQPNQLEELSLVHNFVEGTNQSTQFDISYLITPTLKRLEVRDFRCKCAGLSVSLERLTSIRFLHLTECDLVLDPNICIAPTELTLKNVKIVDTKQNILRSILVNDHFT